MPCRARFRFLAFAVASASCVLPVDAGVSVEGVLDVCGPAFVDAGVVPDGRRLAVPTGFSLEPELSSPGTVVLDGSEPTAKAPGVFVLCSAPNPCWQCATGRVAERPIALQRLSIGFPDTLPPGASTADLGVTNLTDLPIRVRSRSQNGSFATSTPVVDLDPRQTGFARVVFQPAGLGDRQGDLVVQVDDSGFEGRVRLTGYSGGAQPVVSFESEDLLTMPLNPSIPSFQRRITVGNVAPPGQDARGELPAGVLTLERVSCSAEGMPAIVGFEFSPVPRLAPGDSIVLPVRVSRVCFPL